MEGCGNPTFRGMVVRGLARGWSLGALRTPSRPLDILGDFSKLKKWAPSLKKLLATLLCVPKFVFCVTSILNGSVLYGELLRTKAV